MKNLIRTMSIVVLVLAAAPVLMWSADAKVTVWKHGDLVQMDKKLSQELDSESSASDVLGTYTNHHFEIAIRKATGNAELHETQNDVFFIVSGEATLVTGGTLVDRKLTEPHEYEGKSIEGGDRVKLTAGDVVHIPFNIPHQLIIEKGKEIEYFVVKIDAQ
jgi:mannose-6-phosphate isomerase-like protein (cupin superfamily)